MFKWLLTLAVCEARTIVFSDSANFPATHSKFQSLFGKDTLFKKLTDPGEALENFQTVVIANATKFGFREDRSSRYRSFDQEVNHAQKVSESRKRLEFSYQQLLDFVDKGGNLVIFSDISGASEDLKKLVNELGMDFAEVGEFSTTKTLAPVVTGAVTSKLSLTGRLTFAPSNDLVFPVIGDFIGALQARNGARALVVPSWGVFSDSALTDNAGNQQLLRELVAWGSGQKAVLRARELKHHKVGETERPYMYRMSDNITFSIVIEELTDGKWVPYVADDVQLEYTMIDPHVRLPLVFKDGKYELTFKAPDVYGVF